MKSEVLYMDVSNLIDMNALKEDLKKKGYKLTPQRRSIVDTIIENEGQHLTAEEIYDKVKKSCPEIGLATVYRTILLLEELGIISRLDLNDGCSRYEIIHSDETHRHHHLVCNICHKVSEVQDDLLEELEVDIEKQYKFKILDHSVKFFGICDECQKKLNDE
jgi:Fur family ferric uptake transcriptional regulator